MESRLLRVLGEDMKSAPDKVTWARTVCRIASHYARHGDVTNSAQAISTVRVAFENRLQPEVACWLWLAEGIQHFFQMRPAQAYDRTKRAFAIAKALNLIDALPTCAAWMAHLEFNECKYEAMVCNLHLALSAADRQDHQAGGRASLVVADAYHFCGDFDSARPWYDRCRLHATAEGDEAMLSAMMHNMAAFRAANVRLSDAFGSIDKVEARRATVQAQSASSYDRMLGIASLSLLIPLLQGQLLVVDKNFTAALSTFRTINSEHIHSRLVPLLLADIAYCLANLNRFEEAISTMDRAIPLAEAVSEKDDYAYTSARIAQSARMCGKQSISELWISNASTAIIIHRNTQSWLHEQLSQVGPLPDNSEIFRHK